MVYDTFDNYVLLFGGLNAHLQPVGETWAFVGGRWTNLTRFSPGPSARWDAMMTVDPRDGYVLLFGGCMASPVNGVCERTWSDTWTFRAGAWRPVPPGPSLPPPGRWDAAIAFDAYIGDVVMFGGAQGTLDVAPQPPPAPPPGSTLPLLSDTWEYAGGTWTQNPASGPPAGYGARMDYDPTVGGLVLFGGTNYSRLAAPGAGAFGKTWEFSAAGWTLLAAGSPRGPGGRWDAGLAFDARDGYTALFGGANTTGVLYGDVWKYSAATKSWIPLVPTPPGLPGLMPPRWDMGYAYDGWDRYITIFGGFGPSGAPLGDTWKYVQGSVSDLLPNPAPPPSPKSRWGAADAVDLADGYEVLFGGEHCQGATCALMGDTWIYANGLYESVPPSAGGTPSARLGAAMAFDNSTGTVLLFGGCGATCPLGDTWEFSRGAWHQLHPAVSPPARYFSSLTFDGRDQVLVLFGGCGAKAACPLGDTWVYANGDWRNLTSQVGPQGPPARFAQSAAEFPTGQVVMFGGQAASGKLSDTWMFAGLNWSAVPVPIPPPARDFATLVADPVDGVLLLLGGCEPFACPAGDVWVFAHSPPLAFTPFEWTLFVPMVPSVPPLPTLDSAAAPDPFDGPVGYVLYFGGRTIGGSSWGSTGSYVGGGWFDLTPFV